MSLPHLIRYACSLSFGAVAAKGGALAKRLVRAKWQASINAKRSTFPVISKELVLAEAPRAMKQAMDGFSYAEIGRLLRLADNHVAHRFNLLGSRWTKVAHGLRCPGFEGVFYPSKVETMPMEEALPRLSPGNQAPALKIRELISKGYTPIDWQLDFRSGFRWRQDQWSAGIIYGQKPGVDIKVPWELARMQHLPLLAIATGRAEGERKSTYQRECLDQIIDFVSANPPGYGVNWVCTMDVAIRAANMVMTYWLLEALGCRIERQVLQTIAASLVAHGRHIMNNLEWSPEFRANHYLADICGLAFIAAALGSNGEITGWWKFAKRELFTEVEYQFNADGSNFEASVCYHRLAAEMVTYTAALILGRDGSDAIPDGFADFLNRMAHFTADMTKPNGRVAQIGDNDNGRMFKLSVGHVSENLNEDHLDHRALTTAIGALIGEDRTANGFANDAACISALAGGRTLAAGPVVAASPFVSNASEPSAKSARQMETAISLPDCSLLDGLKPIAYSDFGLYIWRSERFFLVVRCGSIGQNGRGGHAHNDQLSIELNINGEDWLADPGSYVYTAMPARRNEYRSVLAHAVPRHRGEEPAALNLGLFRLEDRAQAKCLKFDLQEFEGQHMGFGTPTHRAIRFEDGKIRIRDAFGGAVDWQAVAEVIEVSSASELRRHFGLNIAFSPGYGSIEAS